VTQLWKSGATGLGAGALGVVLTVLAACAPAASSVPLGLGPLAIAERDAQAQAEADRRESKPKAARKPAPAAPAKEQIAEKEAPKAAPARSEPPDSDEAAQADGAGAAGSVHFEGLYAGEDIAVYRWTGAVEQEQRDDKAKIRIEKASGGNVSITLINSADGSDLCELLARVEGNAALIESAQPCFSEESEVTSGRAVLEGDRLKISAQGTISLTLPDQELDGEISYTFEGERQ
jgi:hypothetical protein